MARYHGKVGFAETAETYPDVWEATITERDYYGDVVRNTRRWENGESLNDNLTISNTISIVGDDYAYGHFAYIRYLEWMGTRWKVSSVEIQRPRLILQIGGVYNGDTA